MLLRGITGLSLGLSCVIFALCDMALWLLPVLFAGLWLVLALLAFAFSCRMLSLLHLISGLFHRPSENGPDP